MSGLRLTSGRAVRLQGWRWAWIAAALSAFPLIAWANGLCQPGDPRSYEACCHETDAMLKSYCAHDAAGDEQIPREYIPGSCEDFNKYLSGKGAKASSKDPEEKRHAKWAGVTRAEIQVNGPRGEPRITYSRKKMRDGSLCSTPRLPRSVLQFTQKQQMLYWRPDVPQSKECMAHVRQWSKNVAAHELVHFKKSQEIWNSEGREWSPPPQTEKCAPREGSVPADTQQAEIEKEFTAELKRAILDQIEDLSKKMDKAGSEFHNTPEGQPTPPLDCSICSRSR